MAVNSTGQGRHRHWIVCCLAASPGRNWKGRQELQEMASQEIQEAIAAEVRRDPQPFQSENHPTIYFPHHEMVEGLEEGRFEDWSAPAEATPYKVVNLENENGLISFFGASICEEVNVQRTSIFI